MLIHLVCAARPNFMKVAPLYHALKKEQWAEPVLVHTGQHYDANMSDAFFQDLGLPKPHIYLGVGSGTHAEQTAKVMMAYEKILSDERPDLVIVVGDVNSTMAATIAASKVVYSTNNGTRYTAHGAREKQGNDSPHSPIPPHSFNGLRRPLVAHLEAGLRSRDRAMPEEINRLVTDVLADMLWTPSQDAIDNLLQEGVPPGKIRLVGNIMIDSLEMMREKIESQEAYVPFGLEKGSYGVVTLHRPSNVDDPGILKGICEILKEIAEKVPLVFPIHPRTRKNMEDHDLLSALQGSGKVFLPEPLNYVRFMNLVFNCRLVITDSGGIQEETSYLGIPCLTLRKNTERPITIIKGTNQLCDIEDLGAKVDEILPRPPRCRNEIECWDGRTAQRIVEIIKSCMLHVAS